MNKSYDELVTDIIESHQKTNDVSETAKEVGVSRPVVLEAIGFSEWVSYLYDD